MIELQISATTCFCAIKGVPPGTNVGDSRAPMAAPSINGGKMADNTRVSKIGAHVFTPQPGEIAAPRFQPARQLPAVLGHFSQNLEDVPPSDDTIILITDRLRRRTKSSRVSLPCRVSNAPNLPLGNGTSIKRSNAALSAGSRALASISATEGFEVLNTGTNHCQRRVSLSRPRP